MFNKKFAAAILGLAMLPAAHAAPDALLFSVALDYDSEVSNTAAQDILQAVTRQLSASLKQPVKLVVAQNAERIGENIRTSAYSILLAPSHLIGSSMKHGYNPVSKAGGTSKVVLVASRQSNIRTMEQAKGKRVVLPHPESLVTFVVNGEFNALGSQPKHYFSNVNHVRLYGATLYSLEIGHVDVAAVKENVANEWLSKEPERGVIIKTLHEIPTAGVAVSNKMNDAAKEKIRAAFLNLPAETKTRMAQLGMSNFETAQKEDFEYVSTLGYYTPRVLPGGKIVTAEEVNKMLAGGVMLFDVRPEVQYAAGHIQQARNLPYAMNSPKEINFNDALDKWDMSKLPADKNTALIFQCNGAECWYSYKASRVAIKNGYKNVHWFREGLPSWKSRGYPVHPGA